MGYNGGVDFQVFMKSLEQGVGQGLPPGMAQSTSSGAPAGQMLGATPAPAKEVAQAWQAFTQYLSDHPQLWTDALQCGQKTQMEILAGLPAQQVAVTPPKGDRRWTAPQWSENSFFSFLMQSYLLNANLLRGLIDKVEIPDSDKKVLAFVVNQYIDAMSPTNFPATNPEVIEESVKTGGQNLVRGMQNFVDDMKDGMVKNTDASAFRIGENVATTPGKVVFQNAIFQLVEYAPATPQVHARPLLIVPPCINKFYILDLTQEKSLVRHLVASGHRVFLMSWVNAGTEIAELDWDDYLRDGVMTAIDAVANISRQPQINTLGFCIGGTLLVCALAALAANNEHPAASITLLAAMLDFSDTGEIGLFISEDSVRDSEQKYANGGLVDGRELARGFSVLRPNDLIWPYVINNYYQGKAPTAFDLLFWNSDSTNLPGRLFARYLRMTYLENQIARGCATMCGETINPAQLQCPVYAVACEKDHIVPWQTAYQSGHLICDSFRFVLAANGHIAGIVNPPAKNKGWFYCAADATGTTDGVKTKAKKSAGKKAGKPIATKATAAVPLPPLPAKAEDWHAAAHRHEGSWWADWLPWLATHAGTKTAAPTKPGNMRYAAIEDAPGRYVAAPRPPVPPVAQPH